MQARALLRALTNEKLDCAGAWTADRRETGGSSGDIGWSLSLEELARIPTIALSRTRLALRRISASMDLTAGGLLRPASLGGWTAGWGSATGPGLDTVIAMATRHSAAALSFAWGSGAWAAKARATRPSAAALSFAWASGAWVADAPAKGSGAGFTGACTRGFAAGALGLDLLRLNSPKGRFPTRAKGSAGLGRGLDTGMERRGGGGNTGRDWTIGGAWTVA